MQLFPAIEVALFKTRPNRFAVDCILKGRTVRAHLPNPGRLWELLLPESRLYLARASEPSSRKTKYTAVAVEREGRPVLLHTHRTNDVVHHLIDRKKIAGLEDYSVVRREIPLGRSRFDFLLEKKNRQMILEVKSCTLFGKKIAMFPDAVTDRGRRHLIELARLQRGKVKTGVLFMVHWPAVDFFLPEYHTDLAFSRTLCELKERLFIRAVSVEWTPSLSLGKRIRPLEIPWALAERNLEDRGSYLAILRLKRPTKIPVGKQGVGNFQKGYYVYVGSAKKNLTARMQRHERLRKKKFWHIDYLREQAEFLKALPVRSRASLECAMAGAAGHVSDWSVPRFGSSDCSCPGHLFGFRRNPLQNPAFIQILLHFRIDRLQKNL